MYAIGITNGWSILQPNRAEPCCGILRRSAAAIRSSQHSIYELEDICRNIATELKYQYVLGYQSTNTAKDGEWRKIKVTAEYPNNKLTVRAKAGLLRPPESQTGNN